MLTTANYSDRAKFPLIDYVPLTSSYDYAAAAKERKEGRETWWYVCISPGAPFANLFLTEPATNHRLLLGHMSYTDRVDGFLYYAMTVGWRNNPPIDTGPYVRNWKITNSGDGNLCQTTGPGKEPLPSMRLEAFRDGLEDYEYLLLAEQLSQKLHSQSIPAKLAGQRQDVQRLFQQARENPLVCSRTDYTKDPIAIDAAREELAEFIVSARDFLKTGSE
jgi:hypothetical protein